MPTRPSPPDMDAAESSSDSSRMRFPLCISRNLCGGDNAFGLRKRKCTATALGEHHARSYGGRCSEWLEVGR
jgi:hypothetical protein